MAGIVIKNNASNTLRQIGMTAGSWLVREGAYRIRLRTPKLSKGGELLKTKEAGRKYSHMRFLVGDIPVNNIIFKNEKNDIIEFVNAKIKVAKQNIIVETVLVNRTGTIKEYITAKDYTIDISGDIMVDENYYPLDEIKKINDFLSLPESFSVANAYLSTFDITNLVFDKGDFDQQTQKYFNVLPFKFTFKSDNDWENAYGLIMD